VVVVTGVYLSSTVVGSVDAALLTRYGRLLLLKVVLVGVIGVLGLINHRRIRRAGRLGLAVPLADATAAVLVLGLAALLTSSQPAREPQFVRAPNLATVPVADAPVADLQQALTVRPNLPGHNVALAEVFDTRRPAPAPITGVWFTATEVDGRTVGPVAGQRLPDGQWSAPLDLVSAGRGHITITVRRVGLADAVGRFSWVIGDAGRSVRPVTVSDAPLGAALGWLAAGLLVLFAIAAAVALVRGRSGQAHRPGATHPDPGAPTRRQQHSAASSAAERIGVG
jgi:copper transport protein